MKLLLYATIVGIAVGAAYAQTVPINDPEWKATVRVVDEAGKPMQGVDVAIWHYVTPTNGENEASEKITGHTDASGTFYATAHSRSVSLAFVAQEVGYYTTTKGYELGPAILYDPVKWSPKVTLTLKKIGEPIPMYAKTVNLGMPAFDKAVGFDLMAGDWVAPFGKGTNNDFIFNAHSEKSSRDNFSYKLTVSFADPGDGLQEFKISESEKESALRSPQIAPSDGFQGQWIQTAERKPGEQEKTNIDPTRNYFFRIRTASDANGNVKSALYGKIYGDFLQFRYYLNPMPNSRNMEFDLKRNLITHFGPGEHIQVP